MGVGSCVWKEALVTDLLGPIRVTSQPSHTKEANQPAAATGQASYEGICAQHLWALPAPPPATATHVSASSSSFPSSSVQTQKHNSTFYCFGLSLVQPGARKVKVEGCSRSWGQDTLTFGHPEHRDNWTGETYSSLTSSAVLSALFYLSLLLLPSLTEKPHLAQEKLGLSLKGFSKVPSAPWHVLSLNQD